MTRAKSPKRHTTIIRRPLPIIFALLAVAAGAILAAKLLADRGNDPTPDPATEPEVVTPDDTPTSESPIHIPENKEIPQYDGEDPNTSESLTGTVTTSRISGQNYIIRVNINQYLTSGSCRLEFTGNDVTHTDEVSIIPSATSSTCEGFDIPMRAIGSGTYIYNIYITSGDKSGTISGEVTL